MQKAEKKYKNQNPQQDKAAKKMASLIENMSSWMLTAIKQRTFGAGHALKDLLLFFDYFLFAQCRGNGQGNSHLL